MTSLSRARTAGLALIAGATLAVVPALTASAHVTVSSTDAAPGGSGTLVFRVPTESDSAETTALTVELPDDTPFRSVRAATMPGWSVALERTPLDEPVDIGGFTLSEIVTSVTWTADGPGIGPDEFAEFRLRVGPFPEETATYLFPATQTYSDGEVVAWDQPPADDGGEEPQLPAPTLTVSGDVAAADGHGDAHGAADAASPEGSRATDSTARMLGVVGIAVGVLGFGGGFALGRRGAAVAAP